MKWRLVAALFKPYVADADLLKEIRLQVTNIRVSDSGQFIPLAEKMLTEIEVKAGVLLTHVSMMIAVTGLMLALSQGASWYEALIAFELATYLFLALLTIRCQYTFDRLDYEKSKTAQTPVTNRSPFHYYQAFLGGELFYRQQLLRNVRRTIYFLTFILILTVLFGLFSDEFAKINSSY